VIRHLLKMLEAWLGIAILFIASLWNHEYVLHVLRQGDIDWDRSKR
jgi:hypothetical protein